eukprot:412628-Amphidinium_carterae.1
MQTSVTALVKRPPVSAFSVTALVKRPFVSADSVTALRSIGTYSNPHIMLWCGAKQATKKKPWHVGGWADASQRQDGARSGTDNGAVHLCTSVSKRTR